MIKELNVGDFIFLSSKAHIRKVDDTPSWIDNKGRFFQINTNAIKPSFLDNVFSDSVYDETMEYLRSEKKIQGSTDFNNEFQYFSIQQNNFFNTLHRNLNGKACEIFGEKVKPSYNQITIYNKNGVCPLHVDREQCKYTIDVLLDQEIPSRPWPIWIDDKSYNLKPNQAICYSGTDSLHWREHINQKWATLVFFHFVPENFSGSLF